MPTRVVNFKGMVVSHHADGLFHIVGARDDEQRAFQTAFQVPPPFLWWPAKRVILVALLANVLLTVLFLFDSTELFACLLLASISLSVLFAVGYIHDSFPAIFLHLVACVSCVLGSLVLTPLVYYNQTVCNNEVTCKSLHEWMAHIGAPIVTGKLYTYAAVTCLFHLMMTPVSLRLMKYAAAVEALEKYVEEEKRNGPRQRSDAPKLLFVESV